ncbi:tight junction protein ZO-1-like isoform X3 [Pecten maximus]|uniref:tight junction protein ZO-1-like isoform X3 n=1 Tax=Pecten maximus TaxID=6579 RepID=UPI001458A446|nr:tight junction protein ZO-1-like isoform X3 [Pecten maximus]
MAGKGGVTRLFARHKTSILRDLDVNKVVPRLVRKGIISKSEEKDILEKNDTRKRSETFLDVLSRKGVPAFHEFCAILEELAPHLLTGFLLDTPEAIADEKTPTQALQLGFELALKERDAVLRENAKAVEERDQALRELQQLRTERDSALHSIENLTGKPAKNTNYKNDPNSPAAERRAKSPSRRAKEKIKEMESDTELDEVGDNIVWETHKVTLSRVPRFGFGIAVSGGRDNPHFANGDPSIAISDVLKAGPAEGKLLINDRVTSVNGIPLDNVEHSAAITVLKESGNTVSLVIRRRVVLPTPMETDSNTPLKITLSKRNRKDDFGVVLGCQYFIKEIIGQSLAAQDGTIKEGDFVLKINNTSVENLSLVEAKRLIEKTKDKLQLCVTKKKVEDRLHIRQGSKTDDEYSLGYGTLQGTLQSKKQEINDVNFYRSPSQNDNDLYKGNYDPNSLPQGAYPHSEHVRYDGRYVYDNEAPPRPPLPQDTDAPPRPPSPGKELLRPDDFYGQPKSPTRDQDGYVSDSQRRPPMSPKLQDMTDVGMKRRPHEERYVGKRKDITLEPRHVYFEKEPDLGLGLRLAGGNATGIFIASVQPGSGAEVVGLTEGDQILMANNKEIPGLSREEAVSYLTSLEGRVNMIVQYQKEEYDRIMTSQEAGDSFYIKTHFAYEQREQGELSFTTGDIFHVKDTLFRGVVGSWLVTRVGRNNQETQKGIIPNKNRAEQLAVAKQQSEEEKENSPSKSRSLLFKRKAARRSKSLGKDHWEDVIFSSLSTKFAAYERVILNDCGFHRPVVIFGALADVARDKLLKEYPDKFESPQNDAASLNDDKKSNKSGIIRLGAIKDIIAKRKHCLLDVTPHNVDRLNYAQYYPVVVFLKAENKTVVKESRARFAKGSSKNPKKLFDQSGKLEKMYHHLFTATISHNATDIWYRRLLEMVDLQQKQNIWMSERKPEDDISDDYLFPMSNRLSFAPSQQSELDLSRPVDDLDLSPMHKKRLVRSSSDPSVNTTDRIPGIPPYPAPPAYHKTPGVQRNPGMLDDRRYVELDGLPEDRYYASYYASENRHHPSRSQIDPYATITPHERMYPRAPQDERWFNPAYDDQDHQGNRYGHNHRRSESDLAHTTRQSTSSLPPPQPHHNDQQHHRPYNDNSSYSSDSYTKYTSHPANKHDDSKLREKLGAKGSHDPYRFTRSTAHPVSTAHVDKSKLSDLSARYRKDDQNQGRSKSVPSLRPGTAPPEVGGHQRDPNMKKEPPPVPVKTYNLKDRGIEPDDQKLRNYENSNRSYNYTDSSNYAVVNKIKTGNMRSPPSHDYHDSSENPYDYVAPRSTYQRQPQGNERMMTSHYARPYVAQDAGNPEPHSDRGQRSAGAQRMFVNQMYMDHQELQRLKAQQDGGNNGHPGNMDGYSRDPGYPSAADRPRDRNNADSTDTDERGSAFEAYKKPVMTTFGKSDMNGPSSPKPLLQPGRQYSPYQVAYSDETYQVVPQPHSDLGESEARSDRSGDVSGDRSADQEEQQQFNSDSSGLDSGKSIEEGHTVVATARGIFDHKGGVLESKETGVSIVIPLGAIPEGVQQEIYFKVCKDNNILPPLDREKGETLLSPLVMCGPHGLKFLHPVELRLPHCASVNPDSWSFALKSSDSPSGHPTQWQNMNLAGMDQGSQGKVGKSSVSVLVDHF